MREVQLASVTLGWELPAEAELLKQFGRLGLSSCFLGLPSTEPADAALEQEDCRQQLLLCGAGWVLDRLPCPLCLRVHCPVPEPLPHLGVPTVAMVVLGPTGRPCCFRNEGKSLAGSGDPVLCEWGPHVRPPLL